MNNRSDNTMTLGDYFALAIAPALIMALVVSLVFFLVEVVHAGLYQGRLQWILFCFVFGAVLIARMTITGEVGGRANIYGIGLGGATWLGLASFVEYPPESRLAAWSALINLGLIVLVWWCAHRLTWDCTYMDDDGAEGRGVLQAAGLDAQAAETITEATTKKTIKESRGLAGWWGRLQRYREKKAKRRTPGVWVIYFSLAALPLFGLGQSLIPVEHEARRRYAFWLLTVYVGSGLGLLLVTTFLGLRRYLRRRNVTMPMAIARRWVTLGVGLIALVLAVGAFLPRPAAEYPLFEFTQIGSQKKTPSKKDALGGQGAEGHGQAGDPEENPDGDKGQEPKEGDGQPNKGGNQGKDKDKGKAKGQGQKGQGKGDKKDQQQQEVNDALQQPPAAKPPWLEQVLTILKWIVFGLLALVIAVLVLRAALQFLANFTGWARGLLDFFEGLWQRLFGKKTAAKARFEPAVPATPPRTFASFRNPFADGSAYGMAVLELIELTFKALEAWARERDLARPAAETPLEFSDRLGQEFAELRDDLRRLAQLHARACYAPHGPLPGNALAILEKVWDRLEEPVMV